MSEIALAIDQFDIEQYVEEFVGEIIQYISDGQELKMYCPFCPSHDPDKKGKFYVNTIKKTVFCQRCRYGYGKDTVQFIADVENISRAKAIDRLIGRIGQSFGSFDKLIDKLEDKEQVVRGNVVESIALPPGCIRLFTSKEGIVRKRIERYVLKRGITKKQLKRHQFYFCSRGKWKNRLVIPVFFEGTLVHWVARDLSGTAHAKYLGAPNSEQSFWLYNWDYAQKFKSVVVVEGVFDVFGVERAGFPAVASFGKGLSDDQANLLRHFEEVIILYDPEEEAIVQAYKSADKIFGTVVRIGILKDVDPGDAKPSVIREVVNNTPVVGSPEDLQQLFNYML